MNNKKLSKDSQTLLVTVGLVGSLLLVMLIGALNLKASLKTNLTQGDSAAAATFGVPNVRYSCVDSGRTANVTWDYNSDSANGPVSYRFRADRTTDPWTDQCPLFSPNGGDVCQNNLSVNSFSLPVTSGALYHVWVHAENNSGISSPTAIGVKCSATGSGTPGPSATPGRTSSPVPTSTPSTGLRRFVEAEAYSQTGGTNGVFVSGNFISGLDSGDYVSYDEMNLYNVRSITFKASSRLHSGYVEIRRGSATTGTVIGTWYPTKTQDPGQPKVFVNQTVQLTQIDTMGTVPAKITLVGKNDTFGIVDIDSIILN